MSQRLNLKNVSVVLHRPRYPENIGAAARAICNMGINDLWVVDPENYVEDRVLMMATHAAAGVVENIQIHENLKTALSRFQYVVGTTARLGQHRNVTNSPSTLAEKLVPISQNNSIALLFGPENTGLTNEDIRNCHILLNIPTAEFRSINLAQSVMIICWEIFKASAKDKNAFSPRLATRHELEGLYDHLKDILVRIDCISPENPDYWIDSIRHFFSRLPLRAKEVKILRGICRQIDWYGRKCYDDGIKGIAAERIPNEQN
jgi:tRNA/rRNA methyltransferase